jgi:hypothetical protein
MDDLFGEGRAKGGHARAEALAPRKRSEIARKAAKARWRDAVLNATHGSVDHPLKIGDIEIPCYVLENGARVLALRGLYQGVGLSLGGGQGGVRKIAQLLTSLNEKGINIRELLASVNSPIRFIPPHGGNPADGYEATILPDLCAVLIEADQSGKLGARRKHLAERAAKLQHGFATVGIIALVDEATGYQKDRAKDALSKILEAFIAKELQPYIPTFPTSFYEQLFRLRGLEYPTFSVKRPQYFGVLTNDIVYKRLAPGVLAELKQVTPKNEDGRRKHKYFQRLTGNIGYPKLMQHLGSVITIMKLSNDYRGFISTLDRMHPRYGDTIQLPFEYQPDKDDGKGL